MTQGEIEAGRRREERSKVRLALGAIGGIGLLGCVACCGLPLLGALGIAVGSGAAAVTGMLEPIAAVMLGIGLIGLLTFGARRLRRAAGQSVGTWCAPGSWCCLLARKRPTGAGAAEAAER